MNGESPNGEHLVSLRNTRRAFFIVPLVSISLFWALLYVPNLRTSPRWYGDETLTLMIGKALFAGHPADRSLKITFWHPSYTYQPGYAWFAGGMAWLFGGDILGARVLNVLLALAIATTMYLADEVSSVTSPPGLGLCSFWDTIKASFIFDGSIRTTRWPWGCLFACWRCCGGAGRRSTGLQARAWALRR